MNGWMDGQTKGKGKRGGLGINLRVCVCVLSVSVFQTFLSSDDGNEKL